MAAKKRGEGAGIWDGPDAPDFAKAGSTSSVLKPPAYVVLTAEQMESHVDMYDDLQIHHVIERGGLSYNVGVAFSYLYRAGNKPGNSTAQDIKKAIQHLQFELEAL